MVLVSVSDAATELDVSPRRVRQMLAAGQLPGQQVGRTWVIERVSLDELRRADAGRPWSARSAWAVLGLASGDEFELTPVERSRARRRIAENGLAGLVDQLRSRAGRRAFYAHPSALARVAKGGGVVRGGVSASAEHATEVIAVESAEIYVRESQLSDLVDRYELDADAERPNLVIRVVGDEDWPFDSNDDVAPWPVVAVDLLDASDERSRRAGLDLIERYSKVDA